MALSVTIARQTIVGDIRYVAGTVSFDASYTTGGLSLTAAQLGLSATPDLVFAAPKQGVIFEYDYTNQKLKAVFPTGGSGTPAAGLGVPLINTGATAVTGSAATGPFAPGVGAEVVNAQNLSTLVNVPFVAFGK